MSIDTPSQRSRRLRAASLTATVAVGLAALLLPGHSRSSTGVITPPPPAAACSTGPLSVGDALINTPTGGDADFFSIPPGPPNIMFLLGNNDTMQDFIWTLPNGGTSTGCDSVSNPDLNGTTLPPPPATPPVNFNPILKFYKPASADPKENGTVPFDADPDFSGSTVQFFDPGKFYTSFSNRMRLGSSLGNSFTSTTGDTTADLACARFISSTLDPTNFNACKVCLNDPAKGWYRWTLNSSGQHRWILSGKILNVLPPKFAAARKVVKDVIQTVSNVRVGVATFGPDRGYYDPPALLHPVKPNCDKAFPILDQNDLATARNDIIHQINQMTFINDERSIGEALFGLGGYFSSEKTTGRWSSWFTNPIGAPDGYPGSWTWSDGTDMWTKNGSPWESGGNQLSICWACQSSAILVVSDGIPLHDNSVPESKMMQLLISKGARHPDGAALTFTPGNNTNPAFDPGGINYCDRFGVTKTYCDYDAFPSGPDTNNLNFMDDVAFFLAHMDLRNDYNGDEGLDSGQRVRTYTIGFGDNSPILKSIAYAGQGKFYTASNPDQLRDAITRAINDVKETATSFSSANLTPVQTGGQQYSAYVPRFIPHNDQPYEGHLFRFQYYSEFVEGCDVSDATSMNKDLDKDGKCDSVFLLDKPDSYTMTPGQVPDVSIYTSQSTFNQNIIQENKDGVWVRVATATVDSTTGKLIGGTPAVPFWDAGAVLRTRSASAPCPGATLATSGGRCIFTLIDRDTNGILDDRDNPPIEFIDTNLAQLQPYLLSGGDAFCNDVFAKLGGTGYTGSAADQTVCARAVINFVRGVDVFDYDGDTNRTENRPCANNVTQSCMLGDIFHSSPIVVDPPVDPFICDVGLHNQCVRTLYMDYAAYGQPPVGEPLCNGSNGPNCYMATPMVPPLSRGNSDYGAYAQYVSDFKSRDRFILVGANDGMLHAFHTGSVIPLKPKKNALDDVYDLGTGQEMWAFIPPDLLPKLGLMAKGHQYMVDGTPMVRDVWVDTTDNQSPNAVTGKDSKKQAREYHTLAILSERGGGNRYLALDVTDPWAMNRNDATLAKPFRWMWPNVNDPEAAEVGESWQNFAPKPPPIGPVRIENSTEPLGRGWDETWIVMLNGGYSSDLTRGRGVYMVDAWSGKKLWSFVAKPTAAATGDSYVDNVENRMMPVPAAVAMVDIGAANSSKNDTDGFFDTAMVGDVGGQMWTFRFYRPGQTSGGVVTNWYGARSLEMSREDLSGPAARTLKLKQPFFNIASNTLQTETGWIRTFAGTGDRQNLRDTEATGCAPSNLLACARLKCDADVTLTANVNGLTSTNHLTVAAGVLTADTVTTTGAAATGNTCNGGQLGLTSFSLSCPTSTSMATNPWTAPALTPGNTCANASGSYSCAAQAADMDAKGDLAVASGSLSTIPKNRFFGFYSFGGSDRSFDDRTGALAYDAKRVTDGTFTCSSSTGCGLTNVTLPSSARITVTVGGKSYQVYAPNYTFPKAPATGPGWYLAYENVDEKSGAGSSVLGGIVFWPSFFTQTVSSGPCINTSGDQGKSWQADIITGAPDQGESFKVYDATGNNLLGYQQNKQRSVSAPPPEPANVISISKTGQVRYGISVIEPGSKPSQETLRNKSSASSDVYWLEVPRSLHQCRHVNGQACN